MGTIYTSVKDTLKSQIAQARVLERPIEVFSSKLWPWSDSKLIWFIGIMAVLDYISTYAFLTFGSNQVFEGGLLASWALRTGGFIKLLLVDIVAVATLIVLAVGIRSLYSRLGLGGLGRTAFLFILIPYFIVIMAVVYNNIFWAML